MIVPSQSSSAAWSRYLARYHAAHPGITEALLARAPQDDGTTAYEWMVEPLGSSPGRVLDLGCGSAPLHPRLAHAESYLGVDLSERELAVARSRHRTPVIRGDVRRLPVPDASVDSVVASMSLMLVMPLSAGLLEIRRVLAPGGRVVIMIPAAWPVQLRDLGPLMSVSVRLRGGVALPQLLSARRLSRQLRRTGLTAVHREHRRFPYPVWDGAAAHLAVEALYTPHRSEQRRRRAGAALARHAGPDTELPIPLARVVAQA